MQITESGYYLVHQDINRPHCLIDVRFISSDKMFVFFINYTGWWFCHESHNFFIDEFHNKFVVEKRVYGSYDEDLREFTYDEL
jgi:hypothetical protein